MLKTFKKLFVFMDYVNVIIDNKKLHIFKTHDDNGIAHMFFIRNSDSEIQKLSFRIVGQNFWSEFSFYKIQSGTT